MFNLSNFEFHSPWFLLLFFLFVPLILRDIVGKKSSAVLVPGTEFMRENAGIVLVRLLLKITKYIILGSTIIAMARPRTFTVSDDSDNNRGIDIMLAVDTSMSMLAKDLDPDRISVLKTIAEDFITKRTSDRIGLVSYSGEALTKVPLTTDHQVVIDELQNLRSGDLEQGTSIGDGLAVAVNHIKNSKAKSKIIILMTDGKNTLPGAMDPMLAAEIAKNNDIKVYTIGIGTNGFALMPVGIDPFGEIIFQETMVEIDEVVLQNIANTTGGKYFRATTNRGLSEIYNVINSLEKSNYKTNKFYNYTEYFRIFLWIALAVLLLDALWRWVFYKILS